MEKTADLISRMQLMSPQFSKREKKVAVYILNNLDHVVHQKQSEIAENSGVSVATVNRLCQAVGCEGFKDFRIQLAMNISVSLQYIKSPPFASMQSDLLAQQVIGGMIDMLTNTLEMLNSDKLKEAINILTGAQRIAFFGVGGGSAIVAREGANRFFRLGLPSEAHEDGYYQRMLASTFGPDDVVVAISQSGRAQELVDSIRIAKQYQAKTICITRPNTPLSNDCDVAITFDLPESSDIFKPSASRIAFISVIDILATGVARSLPEQSRENLRRIRSSLVSLQADIEPRPIGD